MNNFYSLAHINPSTMDAADDTKHVAWLDGLCEDKPADYAALARDFFSLAKNAEAFQAFLRYSADDYELATGSRDDE